MKINCNRCGKEINSDYFIFYSTNRNKYFYFCSHCIEKMQIEIIENINEQIEKFRSNQKENIVTVTLEGYEYITEKEFNYPTKIKLYITVDIGFICKMIDSNELILASVNGYAYPEWRKQEFALSIFDKVSL